MKVVRTPEFERIAALPRRRVTLEQATARAQAWTRALALRADVSLRPWQGAALHEAHTTGGAWLAMPVGLGKTLISALLPTVLRAERALLIVPAALRAKTYADFASFTGAWRMPSLPIRVESREMLATTQGATLLDAFAPDLVMIDEADDLSNARSAAARRIDRYVRANAPRVVAMTGTPARKSILDYWHLLAWTLGDGAPIPLSHEEAFTWSRALDEFRGQHFDPGPLGPTVRAARAWYRARVVSTPGVLVVDEDSCDAPLTIRVRLARDDAELDRAFERFLVEQENPGGIPVSDPLSRWLLDAQLGLGLYTRWAPAPPEAWRVARRDVARFVRERIDASTRAARPLDTEAQVLRAYPDHPAVAAWLTAKPLFDGATETVWFSRATLDSVHDWLSELGTQPGIVWCGSVDFGRALAAEAHLPYFGRMGRTDEGASLHTADPKRSMVCSWGANKKGFNLQPWARALVVMPPQSAKWLEQIFGRTHRAGQEAHVIVDVLATSGGTLDAFDAAIAEAGMVRDTIAMTQKVLRADVQHATAPDGTYRWARRETR